MNPRGNQHGPPNMYGGGPPPNFMQQQFDISRSNLRATATEFVPTFMPMQASFPPPQHHGPPPHQHQRHMPPPRHQGPPPQQHHMQQRPPRHHGQQPRHSYQQPPAPQQQQEDYMSTMYMFRHGNAHDRIQEAIKLLIDNPGNFEDVMPELTQSLTKCISNEQSLLSIVNELFTQSVRENNFRYTGARMCNYFSHHLNVNLANGNFRTYLLERCQAEYEKRDSLLCEATTHAHFIGFALFLGELLLNMKEANGEGRMEVLVPLVHQLINLMLDRTEDKFLRCAVQVLKLTGAILSDLEKKASEGLTPVVDAIFVKIRAGLLDEKFSRSIKNMLLGVVELRAKDWGRMEPDPQLNPQQANPYLNQAPMAMSPPMPPPEQFMFPPGMGGMDGNHVPPMFNNQGDFVPPEFLEAGGDLYWSNPEESEYYDYLMFTEGEYPTYSQDDEFDDEIAAAYEEFMRDNQHQH